MTDKTAALLALAERVEGGEDLRSPVFAREIIEAVGIETRDWGAPDFRVRDQQHGSWVARPLLYRLDDVESLRKRLLPGMGFLIGKGRVSPDEPLFGAIISALDDPNDEIATGEHPTELAGAFLVAILRAVAAQAEDEREPFGRDQGKEIIG